MATYYFDISNSFTPDYSSTPFTSIRPGSYADVQTLLSGGETQGVTLNPSGDILRLRGTRVDGGSITISLGIGSIDVLITSWEDNVPYIFKTDTSPFFTIEQNSGFYISDSITIQNGIFDSLNLISNSTSNGNSTSLNLKNCIFYNEFWNEHNVNVFFFGCTFNNLVNFYIIAYTFSPSMTDAMYDLNFYDNVFIDSIPSDERPDLLDTTSATFNFYHNTFTNSEVELESNLIDYTYVGNEINISAADFEWSASQVFPIIDEVEPETIIYGDYDVEVSSTEDRTSFWEDNNIIDGLYGYSRYGRGAFNFNEVYFGHIGSYYFGGEYENTTPDISIPHIELEVLSENFISIGITPTFEIPEIIISPIDSNIVTTSEFCSLEFSAAPLSGGTPLTVKFTAYGQKSNVEISEYRWWFEHNITSGVEDYISCAGPEAYHTYCGSYLQQYDVKLSALCKKIEPDILIDGDGNEYTTVVIGSREWTVENWRSTKYMDGTAIPNVTNNSEWEGLSTPAYAWYNNDSAQGYGALYNWWVVDPDNPKQIAPEGWGVPTDADWTALEDYLIANGYNWDGTTQDNKIGKALASNGGEWATSNTEGRVGNDQGSNNSSGFSALPGGFRVYSGFFASVGYSGYWWSVTEYDASSAWVRTLGYDNVYLDRSNIDKGLGLSVRLVRDI